MGYKSTVFIALSPAGLQKFREIAAKPGNTRYAQTLMRKADTKLVLSDGSKIQLTPLKRLQIWHDDVIPYNAYFPFKLYFFKYEYKVERGISRRAAAPFVPLILPLQTSRACSICD